MFIEILFFHRCHRKTRVKVEQTFGQLKRRFPCLSNGIRVQSPERATGVIIKACCVLHNLCKAFGEPEMLNENEVEDIGEIPYAGPIHDGLAHRQFVINNYFN